MCARLGAIFATRTRDEWAAVFDGQGACVTPVLSLTEAVAHPHNIARRTYDGLQPSPAPRFSRTPTAPPRRAPVIGADD
jgi:alpha-methylacyl-CoA racemase